MSERPTIVCLCGSARFQEQFQRSYLEETLAGHIVLSSALAPGGDAALFETLSPSEREKTIAMLDDLHRHKIDLADEVLVLNVDGYLGTSTTEELAYARQKDKIIRFLE